MTPKSRCGSAGGRWIALGVAGASAMIAGCSSRAGAERVPPPEVVVRVVEARRMTVPIMAEGIATTTALQEVSIRARVRGFLKEIHFKEGQDVKADQLLFVIDEEPFKAKVAEDRAKLEQAEASLKKARESKAREVAAAQLTVDDTALTLSKVEEERQIALYKRNATTPQDVDRYVANRKRNEAQVEADKANLEQAKADFETNIKAAEANVDAAKAQLQQSEIDLGYCRMFSPIDGRIGLAEVKVGNLVGTPAGGPVSAALGGQQYTELAVVRQLDPMGVDIQAPSRVLDRAARLVDQGLAVDIYRPGLEGEEDIHFKGKVAVIDNSINSTTSTFQMRAEVANPARTILPGEYVKVNAKVGEVKDAVVVPEQAVVESQAGPTVYTVDAKGTVAVVPVRATFTHEGLRVLESGLQPGQQVIVEGLPLVRNGMTVKTKPASPDDLTGPAGAPTSPGAAAPAPATGKAPAEKPAGTKPKT
jgi:RND family efflux transporter MFP subunit